MTETAAPLRIGVFGIRTIPSTYSGYETFATVLLPELTRRGHDVTLFVRDHEHAGSDYKGVKRLRVPSISTKQLDTISHGWSATVAAITKHRFDVVLAFNVANAPMMAALRATGTPTVLNVDGQEWLRGKWGAVGRRVFRASARISKRCADTLVTDCHAMQHVYRDQFNAESEVIPYCWTELLTPAELENQKAADRLAKYDLEPGRYVVTGGRLVPENNVDKIVESYCRTTLDRDIVVLGTANYDSPVTRAVQECATRDSRVRFLGHVHDRRDFGAILANAAVYFHGHSVGGINPSLIEAMGVGAHICALDTPFNREALGDAGRYFSDPATAATEAVHLQSASHEFDHLPILARKRAQEEFGLERIAT
ncbi:MAG: glycosyltransferase, partial [Acidimicrobiales bacterium]|nr:glycosyltransferase [Acidimicrobiales bacterium]